MSAQRTPAEMADFMDMQARRMDHTDYDDAEAMRQIAAYLRAQPAALAPQEAAPMPPIEIGDWICGTQSGGPRRVFDHDDVWAWEKCEDMITEIRKANGTVWRREPRR